MRKAFKWIGIGCGGLFGLFVVIVIIAALVSGGGSDESEVSLAGDSSEEAQRTKQSLLRTGNTDGTITDLYTGS